MEKRQIGRFLRAFDSPVETKFSNKPLRDGKKFVILLRQNPPRFSSKDQRTRAGLLFLAYGTHLYQTANQHFVRCNAQKKSLSKSISSNTTSPSFLQHGKHLNWPRLAHYQSYTTTLQTIRLKNVLRVSSTSVLPNLQSRAVERHAKVSKRHKKW